MVHLQEPKAAGYTLEELLGAGFTEVEAEEESFTKEEIKFTSDNIKAASVEAMNTYTRPCGYSKRTPKLA